VTPSGPQRAMRTQIGISNAEQREHNMKSSADSACPCGQGASYEHCCGRWHQGPQRLAAPDAETLMRSRYSAFVKEEWEYLLDTWHASTRPERLEPHPSGLQWLGLQVRRQRLLAADRAEVEFVARSRWQGRGRRHHESSRFVYEEGRWWYVDGDILP